MSKQLLQLPRNSDGSSYNVAFLRRDQQQVLAIVLQNIYAWLFGVQWSPLRLTVSGVAGSDKSTLIHTIVSTVRSSFQRNDAVRVCGPTGSAAFSAGGETIHWLFSIKVHNMTEILSATTRERLMQKFSNLVVLIVDERSMVGSELLAVMESFSHQTVHTGMNSSHPWGVIPVIILVGDDHQLPTKVLLMLFFPYKTDFNCSSNVLVSTLLPGLLMSIIIFDFLQGLSCI